MSKEIDYVALINNTNLAKDAGWMKATAKFVCTPTLENNYGYVYTDVGTTQSLAYAKNNHADNPKEALKSIQQRFRVWPEVMLRKGLPERGESIEVFFEYIDKGVHEGKLKIKDWRRVKAEVTKASW